jgi:hypothetical protein
MVFMSADQKKTGLTILVNGQGDLVEDVWDYYALRQAVGGDIEGISLGDNAFMWVNALGKYNCPLNEKATKLFLKAYPYGYDTIHGDVVVFACDEEGDTISITDEIMDMVKPVGLLWM